MGRGFRMRAAQRFPVQKRLRAVLCGMTASFIKKDFVQVMASLKASVGGLFFIAMILAGCGESEPTSGVAKGFEAWVGRDVSALVVQSLDGEMQPLKDVAVEGKPVVVNVWATWCPPCLKEMPTLDALGKQGQYTVVAIATDGDVATVKEFLKKQEWGGGVRIWFDANGMVTREKLGAGAVPVTYVLDKDLKVTDVQTGAHDWMARLGMKN